MRIFIIYLVLTFLVSPVIDNCCPGLMLYRRSSGGGFGPPVDIEIAVANDNDDSEEDAATGTIDLGSSDLEITMDRSDSEQVIGVRFVNTGIPPGSLIVSCVVEFDARSSDSGTATFKIHVQNIGNAPVFSTTDYDVSSRFTSSCSQPSGGVTWTEGSWSSGNLYETDDFSSELQVAINHASYTSSSAIVVGIFHTSYCSEVDDRRNADSFTGNHPLLKVTYQAPL